MTERSAIGEVLNSILWTFERHGNVSVCYVSDDEYRAICQEHVGGPWFGGMTIAQVPIKLLSQIGDGEQSAETEGK